jgi:hypothetical protein
VLTAGWSPSKPYGFDTLGVLDWSASGRYLLVHQRRGTLHMGLKPSAVWVYDRLREESRLLETLPYRIAEYWQRQGAPLPETAQDTGAAHTWDLTPLGWLPGSDTKFWFEVWEWRRHPSGKVAKGVAQFYRGLWQADLQSGDVRLLRTLPPRTPPPVARNGIKFVPDVPPPRA